MNIHALPIRPLAAVAAARGTGPSQHAAKTAIHDARWPQVADALSTLRLSGRHAVRIVDAECSAGTLLLHAVRHARMLGFTAIEGRGIGGSPGPVGRARAAANRAADPAVGVSFEVADMVAALQAEQDLPADIILCHGVLAQDRRPDVVVALRRAGRVVIDDGAASYAQGIAA